MFTPDGSGDYTELQLTAPDSNASFGISGAVQGDGTIVVGASGVLYIHEPDGSGNYSVSKLITGPGGTGSTLAVNEAGVIVTGATSDNGAAYVYVPDGAGGYKEIVLTAHDGASGDYFGQSVSINEDGVITIGAHADDDKGQNSGSVYVFTLDADGNYVGADGTVYEPSDTPPVIESFETTSLTINGSDAAEVLNGGLDADVIAGNDGDDVLSGGSGDDQLTGGAGNDTFKFADGESGHDVIADFEAGAGSLDVIEFESAVFADFDALKAAVEDSGADAVITIDDDTSITLKGVNSADLHQDDFTFV
ncbi:Poly(beta-D-mannuronate) C5 epimerase 6 [Pseudovibrio sp. Ad46]|nr:Poly(beta-D-mannuronate) C5 epimerase 6 [Pseudovibrio sp. Ad46]